MGAVERSPDSRPRAQTPPCVPCRPRPCFHCRALHLIHAPPGPREPAEGPPLVDSHSYRTHGYTEARRGHGKWLLSFPSPPRAKGGELPGSKSARDAGRRLLGPGRGPDPCALRRCRCGNTALPTRGPRSVLSPVLSRGAAGEGVTNGRHLVTRQKEGQEAGTGHSQSVGRSQAPRWPCGTGSGPHGRGAATWQRPAAQVKLALGTREDTPAPRRSLLPELIPTS